MSLDLQAWLFWSRGKDPVRSLIELVSLLPDHDSARCQLVSSWLLSVWQLGKGGISPVVPSVILVNSGTDCPVGAALRSILPVFGQYAPPEYEDGRSSPEYDRGTLKYLIPRAAKWKLSEPPEWDYQGSPHNQWKGAISRLFPNRDLVPYKEAWDPEFGLVTGNDHRISLLILEPPDQEAFLADLNGGTEKLKSPSGYSDLVRRDRKTVSLLGTLPLENWTPEVIGNLWENFPSTVHLPYVAPPAIELPDRELLAKLTYHFAMHTKTSASPHVNPLDFPMHSLYGVYEDLIRELAAGIPGSPALALQMLIRFLQLLITRLSHFVVRHDLMCADGKELVGLLAFDLCQMVLRGIAYGVAGHRYGRLQAKITKSPGSAGKVLAHVRNAGMMSKRQLQRKFQTLSATQRDCLLNELKAAGLVEISGNEVAAVSFDDFLMGAPRRYGFPALDLRTEAILRLAKEAKGRKDA